MRKINLASDRPNDSQNCGTLGCEIHTHWLHINSSAGFTQPFRQLLKRDVRQKVAWFPFLVKCERDSPKCTAGTKFFSALGFNKWLTSVMLHRALSHLLVYGRYCLRSLLTLYGRTLTFTSSVADTWPHAPLPLVFPELNRQEQNYDTVLQDCEILACWFHNCLESRILTTISKDNGESCINSTFLPAGASLGHFKCVILTTS